LDAQNAGNDISGIQISKISWESTPPDPPLMRGILATHVAFSHCYPPLIYYLTERSLFKKCPPTGKSLKKVLFHPMIIQAYRKPPTISPGLIYFRKRFLMGLYKGGLIYGGGGYTWTIFCVSNKQVRHTKSVINRKINMTY
jgi:hypothetical protein